MPTDREVGTCSGNSDSKVAANHTEKWTITLPFICRVDPLFWPWKIPVHSAPLYFDVSHHQVLYSFPWAHRLITYLAFIGMEYSVGASFSVCLSGLFTSHKKEPCIAAMLQHFQEFSNACGFFFFFHLFKKSETLKANDLQIVTSNKNQSQKSIPDFLKSFEVPQLQDFSITIQRLFKIQDWWRGLRGWKITTS